MEVRREMSQRCVPVKQLRAFWRRPGERSGSSRSVDVEADFVEIRRCCSARPRPKKLWRRPKQAAVIWGVGALGVGARHRCFPARKVSMKSGKLQLHVLEWLLLAMWRRHVNAILSVAAAAAAAAALGGISGGQGGEAGLPSRPGTDSFAQCCKLC